MSRRRENSGKNYGWKVAGLTAVIMAGVVGYGHYSNEENRKPAVAEMLHSKGDTKLLEDKLDSTFLHKMPVQELELIQERESSNYESLQLIQAVEKIHYKSALMSNIKNAFLQERPNLKKRALLHGLNCQSIKMNPIVEEELRMVSHGSRDASFLSYAKAAVTHLYGHSAFSDVPKPNIVWNNLKLKEGEVTGMVGLNVVSRVNVRHECLTNDEIYDSKFTMQRYIYGGGSRIWEPIRKTDDNNFTLVKARKPYFFICSAGDSAGTHLQSPFSEILPYIFREKLKTFYESKTEGLGAVVGPYYLREMYALGETISESLAIQLSKEMLEQNKFSPTKHVKMEDLDNSAATLASIDMTYIFVPAGMEYIKNYGLDDTVKNFMNDPVKYFEDVKEIHASMQ